MKALVVEEPGRIALQNRPQPDVPEGWVKVAMTHAGICGTDYHIFTGHHPFLQYPRLIGHELAGRVVDAGHGFAAGEVVIINPYLACGTCRACTRGRPNTCTSLSVLGVHRDGGMCQIIAMPPGNLYPAQGLAPQHAALVEFLAIGAHGVRRAELTPGDRVLVAGAGPIGLGVALFARLQGANVHLLDASPSRLAMVAGAFGFTDTHGIEGAPDAVLAATGGDGFDVVFDATGNPRAMEAAFAYAGHGGHVVLVSVVKDRLSFDDPEFHRRELRLSGSRNATRADFDTVIAALCSGQIDGDRLITHRCTLDQAADRLPEWAAAREGVIKAMIEIG